MGPSEKALSNRKSLGKEGSLTLSLDEQNYNIVLCGQIARIQLKNITCEVPFVAWDGLDEAIEQAIIEGRDYSRDLGVAHRLRFPEDFWGR